MKFRDYDPAIAAEFVAGFEDFRANAYKCPAGVWTIGYGHTKGVKEGDTITEEDALQLLTDELGEFAQQAAPLIKVDVTEGQFIALMSFIYNFGLTKFRRSSVLRNLNKGAIQAAADAFLLWVAPGTSYEKGLRRRRTAERKIFLS